ncbi:MAG: protein BatD, partial [Bacteroidales bacterium]|nr:protein BatD [Bacteroidales bacterium]
FTIPAATAVVENKKYTSNTVKIEVIAGEKPSATPQSSNTQSQQTQDIDVSDELFIRILTDRKNIYRGEYIIATIKLYTRLSITGFGESEMPDFQSFWTQDIESPTQLNLVRENVNGKIFNTAMIKKVILFPQKTGEITIDPFKLETYIRQQTNRPRSPFDDFFGNSYTNVVKPLVSNPVKIRVKDLPAGAPEGYAGAVGDLAIKAEIDNQEAVTNDALTYKVTVSGNGNVQLIDAPRINFPPDFETYDPKVQTNVTNGVNGQSGRKTFEYLLIPRHAGNFRIPQVSLAYFEPTSGQYRTSSTTEFNIAISKGDEEETVSVIAGRSKEDLKIIGSDILFIKDNQFKLFRIGQGFFGSSIFYLLYAGLFILFIGILLIRRKRIQRQQNVELVKNQRASREARRRLKEAATHMKKNESEAFYEAVLKALTGYLVDKLNIPMADLSKDSARKGLQKYDVKPEAIEEYLELADVCEMARYSPTAIEGGMGEVYSRSI